MISGSVFLPKTSTSSKSTSLTDIVLIAHLFTAYALRSISYCFDMISYGIAKISLKRERTLS